VNGTNFNGAKKKGVGKLKKKTWKGVTKKNIARVQEKGRGKGRLGGQKGGTKLGQDKRKRRELVQKKKRDWVGC